MSDSLHVPSDLNFLVPLQMLRDGVELPNAAAIFGQDIGRGQVPHDFSTEVHKGPAVIHAVNLGGRQGVDHLAISQPEKNAACPF